MYKDELRSCEIGKYSLEQTHQFLLENENVRNVHLKHLHGLPSEQLGLTDINNTVLVKSGDDTDGSKHLCQHFCKTDKCKFGFRCKYLHPTRLVDAARRKKKGICRNFTKDGKCKSGDKCIF